MTQAPPSFLMEMRADVDEALRSWTNEQPDGRITEAVRRALTLPGKRLRPIVCLLAAEAVGGEVHRTTDFALAVEMIHTASLVLDDLPCMDDADTRRGRPALHVEIGEADATLAAMALVAHAFEVSVRSSSGSRRRKDVALGLVQRLADAVGVNGMCEGQSLDLALGDTTDRRFAVLEGIHRRKTGVLFATAFEGGARLAAGGADDVELLVRFGRNLGLAYQIADDILDVTGSTDRLGKPVASDAGRRLTFVSLFGLADSRRAVAELHDAARTTLKDFGRRGDRLRELVDYLEHRDV